MAWSGMAWSGMEWHGVEWRGVVWSCVELRGGGNFFFKLKWHEVAWSGMEWHGVVEWQGVAWRGVAWNGVQWCGVARVLGQVVTFFVSARLEGARSCLYPFLVCEFEVARWRYANTLGLLLGSNPLGHQT